MSRHTRIVVSALLLSGSVASTPVLLPPRRTEGGQIGASNVRILLINNYLVSYYSWSAKPFMSRFDPDQHLQYIQRHRPHKEASPSKRDGS